MKSNLKGSDTSKFDFFLCLLYKKD